MIQLTHGSIFDKKCDLLVIPCSTHGTVTRWVFSELTENSLPLPPPLLTFGKIIFVETKLSLANAEILGFAASVSGSISSNKAIISIGEAINQYSIEHNLRQVNIPLLGSGAGGLSPLDSIDALIKSLGNTGNIETNFEIFIPSMDIYSSLKAKYSELFDYSSQMRLENPRVFVSYAGDDLENKNWVKNLVIKLRKNGVDAIVDRFNSKHGTDLPQWMTNEIIRADKVLLICDSNYVKKADIHKGGTGWETMIIQGDMLSQGESKTKYIAIVREDQIDKGLPIYMKSKLAFHWNKTKKLSDEEFKELLFAIFDCDVTPELGKIPEYIAEHLLKPF